jgi:hypothetical protein
MTLLNPSIRFPRIATPPLGREIHMRSSNHRLIPPSIHVAAGAREWLLINVRVEKHTAIEKVS